MRRPELARQGGYLVLGSGLAGAGPASSSRDFCSSRSSGVRAAVTVDQISTLLQVGIAREPHIDRRRFAGPASW